MNNDNRKKLWVSSDFDRVIREGHVKMNLMLKDKINKKITILDYTDMLAKTFGTNTNAFDNVSLLPMKKGRKMVRFEQRLRKRDDTFFEIL